MAKPTLLQSFLGRPSQSYSFPQEQNYYSNKAHMRHIAAETGKTHISVGGEHDMRHESEKGIREQGTGSLTPLPLLMRTDAMPVNNSQPLVVMNPPSNSISIKPSQEERHSTSSSDPDEDSDNDVFYTPNTSPRISMVSTLSVSTARQRSMRNLKPDSTPQAALSTKTPSPAARSTSSLSSSTMGTTSLDGHSLFSSDSSLSTGVTSPFNSDTGHGSTPRQKQAYTYTDEDWAKDVRWLVKPSNDVSGPISGKGTKSTTTPIPRTKSKRRSKSDSSSPSSTSASSSSGSLPPPTRLQPPAARIPNLSKSLSKTSPSIMMSMTALLEEDEDKDTPLVHLTQSPRSNVLINGPADTRQRVGSSPDRRESSGSRSHASSSRNTSSTSSTSTVGRRERPNLNRRRSRSLEHLPLSGVPPPESTSSSLPSFNSATSYAPSLPSHGTPGYTSLTLPRAPQPSVALGAAGKRLSVVGGGDGKVDLTRSGIAQTTMASVEVVRGLGSGSGSGIFGGLGAILGRRRTRSTSLSGGGGGERNSRSRSRINGRAGRGGADVLGFTSYRQPPDYVPSGSVLVQVWGVGVDGFDAKLVGISVGGGPSNSGSPAKPSSVPEAPPRTRKGSLVRSVSLRSKKGSQRTGSYDGGSEGGGSVSEPQVGYIPGRSFVGRVLECGWEVKDEVVKRGEWVVGLLDIKKCGALQEFIIVDRHRVYRVPHPRLPQSPVLGGGGGGASQLIEKLAMLQNPQPLPLLRDSSRHSSFSSSSHPSSPSLSRSSSMSSSPRRSRQPSRPMTPPPPPSLTLEELALLPLCGVPAYRAVRTFAFAFASPSSAVSSSPSMGNGVWTTPYGHNPDGLPQVNGRYRVERDSSGKKRRALVLRGHDGIGAMAVQMLVKEGWRVCVHAPLKVCDEEGERKYMEDVEARVRAWGGEEVVFDDGEVVAEERRDEGRGAVVRVIERLIEDGDVFDGVLDTVGGKEVWEASEVLLRGVPTPVSANNGKQGKLGGLGIGSLKRKSQPQQPKAMGQFTTLVGDVPGRVIPSAGDHFKAGLRSLKNTHSPDTQGQPRGNGKVGYAWVSVAQDVDWEGADVRDSLGAVLRMAIDDGIKPWVGEDGTKERVVPFEETPRAFGETGSLEDGGTVVVRIVG